jgi:hypothetical protein
MVALESSAKIPRHGGRKNKARYRERVNKRNQTPREEAVPQQPPAIGTTPRSPWQAHMASLASSHLFAAHGFPTSAGGFVPGGMRIAGSGFGFGRSANGGHVYTPSAASSGFGQIRRRPLGWRRRSLQWAWWRPFRRRWIRWALGRRRTSLTSAVKSARRDRKRSAAFGDGYGEHAAEWGWGGTPSRYPALPFPCPSSSGFDAFRRIV